MNVNSPFRTMVESDSPSDSDPRTKPAEKRGTSAAGEGSRFTLIVVDDEPDLREAIAFDLQRKGFEVITAGSGREAWKILSSAHQINLVITDIKMPDGDGLDLLNQIMREQPNLPVICLTGFAELSSNDILKLGAKAIFEKPFDRKAFHETIAALMPTPKKK
jgi:two-component system response regulator PilR (NtrC family)